MGEDVLLREKIVMLAAAGYRRRDIADLCGVSTEVLEGHLSALGLCVAVEKRGRRRHVVRRRKTVDGRSLAHKGPASFEDAEVEA
jgi:hypothetical protein